MVTKAAINRERAGSTDSWRAGFAKNQTIQRVRPVEDHSYLANPHRGTTTFQRFNGDPLYPGLTWDDSNGPIEFAPPPADLSTPQYPHTTLSYCRWLWSVLEPKKGKFRWDIIDGTLAAARARGQTVQMRIQPYINDDMPAWYWELGGTSQPLPEPPKDAKQSIWGAPLVRREPEHNDPKYLKHFGDTIRAFAKRYDGHPDLESFDVAYGGACGEGGGNASPATAAKLVDVYARSFKKTQLITMLGTPGCRHLAKNRRIGWRADCFGDVNTEGGGAVPNGLNWNHMYDFYPESVHDCGLVEHWKTAPVILETCWTVGFWAKQGWNVDWILEQGLKYHTSVFMPKSSFIPDEWREKVDAFDRRLGYRFVLRQAMLPLEAKAGAKLSFKFWIENTGVAPIYRDYAFALRFRQGKSSVIVPLKTDVRSWLPGDAIIHETAAFPKSFQRGVADVDVGIIDRKSQAARVLFAIEDRNEDRWHPLTRIDCV